jgi:hypothetical protein
MGKPVTEEQKAQALAAFEKCGANTTRAAELIGIPRPTFQNRLAAARRDTPKRIVDKDVDTALEKNLELLERVRILEASLATQKKDTLDTKYIKSKILEIRDDYSKLTIPKWLSPPSKRAGQTMSVPTLMLSDLHWGETVNAKEMSGVNEYSVEVANRRLRTVVEKAIVLLRDHMKNVNYPGFVLPLAGDMLAGDIHEELSQTNEFPTFPIMLDLIPALIAAIDVLKKEFKYVYVPCEAGNHGRTTRKPRAKQRNETNLDWLVYQFLVLHYQNDDNVVIDSPTSPSMTYKVFNHAYHLCHGDQLGKGGDGIIGSFGPIIRGDHKKRSLQSQLNRPYKTLLHGHYHQYAATQRFISNGSLVGYDEYALSNGFGFEIPQQALWLTHPSQGITFSMPVHAD